MPDLLDYGVDCPNFSLVRRDGILQLTLHSGSGSFVFNRKAQRTFGDLFTRISRDPGNRVLIITGTGRDFCAAHEPGEVASLLTADPSAGWHTMRADACAMLSSFVDLQIPVIAAVNGPARCHSELPLAADVVLASPAALFQDATHVVGGMPPGDGVHLVWTHVLGLNRARYYLITGQEITVSQALAWGLVAEVHPEPGLLPRAWEIAAQWARWPPHVLSMWRATYLAELRRLVHDHLYQGLTYEGLAVVPFFSAVPAS